MRLAKAIISIISIIMLRGFLVQSIHGSNAIQINLSQDKFKYEIFNVELNEEELILDGYAFVIEQQHYRSNLTHDTFIEVVNSKGDTILYKASLIPSVYTTHMMHRGTPLCGNNSYRQLINTCYYVFENVQFQVKIPRNVFLDNETYHFNLISHAKNINTFFKTSIQALVKNKDIIINEKNYIFNGDIDSTALKISFSEIVVRNGPSIQSSLLYVGTNCSSTYRNQLFYQNNSIYKNVSRFIFNQGVGLTYYELYTKLSSCINSRRTVIEGKDIGPVFINRLMVVLSGTPLTLEVKPIVNTSVLKTIRYYHPRLTKNSLNHNVHYLRLIK
jgi:hypothetical protein